jgi:hypothetical protein
MRYLVLLTAAPPASPPPPELMVAIAALGEDATRAGVLLDTAGLAPSAEGSRMSVVAGRLNTTDGPFAEAKEMISYALYDVRDQAEAQEWTSRFMRAHQELWPGWEGDAEIRRVFGPEDFGPPPG